MNKDSCIRKKSACRPAASTAASSLFRRLLPRGRRIAIELFILANLAGVLWLPRIVRQVIARAEGMRRDDLKYTESGLSRNGLITFEFEYENVIADEPAPNFKNLYSEELRERLQFRRSGHVQWQLLPPGFLATDTLCVMVWPSRREMRESMEKTWVDYPWGRIYPHSEVAGEAADMSISGAGEILWAQGSGKQLSDPPARVER